jgi:hypothetical protein
VLFRSLEKNLGITGDDGCALLLAVEEKFGISLTGADGSIHKGFDLEEGQYLFHSEGFNPCWLIARLFGRDPENVKAITVGDLYHAVCKASRTASDSAA